MINVHISFDQTNGGIRRVMEAQNKYLPEYGVQPVKNAREAHIINTHGSQIINEPGVPNVHTGHGLYWSRQAWGESYQQANALVIESMKQAVAHTVPSEWVGRAVRRGGFFYPTVVYHGVDAKDFEPARENGEYVLWNKARADLVSDPNDMLKVSVMMPNTKFLSTIGYASGNVEVLGGMKRDGIPFDQMKKIIANAGVYLATARETFGIGILEALACGVPVAGWDWGGQSEIVVQGQTGYLAPPGDYKALAECIRLCFAERSRLSVNARADALTRWKWEPRIEQYADVFKQVYHEYYEVKRKKVSVSVIVTAYELDQYLPVCLQSVKRQTFRDWECIVVDDANQNSTQKIVKDFIKTDKRFKYCPTPENLGLPGARNYGFSKSNGRYIRHLDADDFLAENALELEATGLDDDPGAHIVYGHLEVVREDGSRNLGADGDPLRGGWPEMQFNWYQQMSHLNQLPSCAMMRREVLERTGGYRERMSRNEDAEFWCRATSLGFVASKFTQAVTYFHRQREDSKGAMEWREQGKEPDWTAWFPWRMGAKEFNEGINLWRKYGNSHPKPYVVPFGAQGKPDQNHMRAWYIHDYAYPTVSVIVTCGPGHKQYLLDALDSLQAQTYLDWECIVVNDTGYSWGENIMGAPFVKKVINHENNFGASKARNSGVPFVHERTRWIVWLDADDYWLPWFLERMVAYGEQNKGVIFSDFVEDNGYDNPMRIYRYQEFDATRVPFAMQHAGSSVLIPKVVVDKVIENQGGWDENIPGYEDGDYQTAMYDTCACSYHLDEPLFVYRKYSTTKREKDYNNQEAILAYLDKKWSAYRKGEKSMAGCGCGTKTKVNTIPANSMSSSGNFTSFMESVKQEQGDVSAQMVTVEYVGEIREPFTIRSRVMPGKVYRFGNNDYNRMNVVFLEDAEFLTSMVDGMNMPKYRILGAGAAVEVRDPTVFLGQAIEA